MRSILRLTLMALAVAGLAASAALGAGFQIPEQGSASVALGMGYIGRADDLSAMYHNPAGLTQLQGHNFYLTVAGISPSATYARKAAIATGDSASSNGARFPYYAIDEASSKTYGKAKTKSDLIPVPGFAYGTRLSGAFEKVAVGFGVNIPYGLSSNYAESGPQRYMSTNISLTTIYAGPYVAWQATPALSVGAGVQYVYGKAELGMHANYGGALLLMARSNAALAAALPTIVAAVQGASAADLNENRALDGVVEVTDGTDQGYSATIGALYKVSDRLQVGACFRKGVALKVEGDVALTVPALVTRATGGMIQSLETKGTTTVNLPDVFGLGVSYRPTDKVALLGDLNLNRWASYEHLNFDFAANDAAPVVAAYFPDSKNPRDWENAIAVRLGGEYQLNETQALRLGYLFDQEPIPDETVGPELPTNDRNGITLGYGMKLGKATVDLAFCHLFIKDRTVERTYRASSASSAPVGDYTGSANIGGITLSYRL